MIGLLIKKGYFKNLMKNEVILSFFINVAVKIV